MSDLDKKILTAIAEGIQEDTATNNINKELGLFGLIGESFKGSHRWVVMTVFSLVFVFIGLTVYCGYHLYHTEVIASKFNWLAGTLISAIIVCILRLWYFMELNRLSTKREIKRLQLMVSTLISRLEKS